jgi:hypothetical protein
MNPTNAPRPLPPDHFGLGVAYAAAAHIAVGVTFAIALPLGFSLFPNSEAMQIFAMLASFWLFGIGLSQLVYLVPLAVVLKRKQLPASLAGLLVSMGVVFLLSAACFGLFSSSFG